MGRIETEEHLSRLRSKMIKDLVLKGLKQEPIPEAALKPHFRVLDFVGPTKRPQTEDTK